MRKISFWAREHVWTSRLIIIFLIYPLLNVTGWFIADILALNGVHISQAWGYPLSFILLFLFLIYPFNIDRHRQKNFYAYKKTIDALMICTTFCFILVRGNNFNNEATENIAVSSSYASEDPGKNIQPSSKIKKEQKNLIRKLVKNMRKKYKEASDEGKVGYIILAVFVALLLLLGLGLLTCSIACSGAEGLAYVLFFLGLGAIIFGLVRVIHRIKKGPRPKRIQTEGS